MTTIGTDGNRDGIGTRFTLVIGGVTQIREIAAGSSQMGQNAIAAHFGLGNANVVDSLSIQWPNGLVLTLNDVPANQSLNLIEPTR